MPTLKDLLDPEQASALSALRADTVDTTGTLEEARLPAPPSASATLVRDQRFLDEAQLRLQAAIWGPGSEPWQRLMASQESTPVHDDVEHALNVVFGPRDSGREVVVDPRSEALIEFACQGADCDSIVLVDPVPVGADYDEFRRVVMCRDCARAYLRDKTGHVVRTPRVKHHQPRLEATPEELASADAKRTDAQEAHVKIDLSTMSDAQLGAQVRTELEKTAEAEVRESAPKAKKAKRAKDAADVKAAKKDRKKRKGKVLGEVVVDGSLTIPALDLGDATSLDTVVSAGFRSPYNKARFRVLGEPALEPDTTTLRFLLGEHERLREAVVARGVEREAKAAAQAAEKAAKAAQAKADKKGKKGKRVSAKVGDATPAISRKQAVALVMDQMGVTKKQARALVDSL